MTQWLFCGLVLAVGVERLFELYLSNRSAKQAFAKGGREYGRGHYPWMVLLHTGFLVSCLLEVWIRNPTFSPWIGYPALAFVFFAMVLRYWAVISLHGMWNTRVILVPGSHVSRSGPYRFLKHPNYVAVIVELAALPLVHSAWLTALVVSLLNAWLLSVRIHAEEEALSHHTNYLRAFADTPRFIPKQARL